MTAPRQSSEIALLRALLDDIFVNWRTVDLAQTTEAEREAIEFLLAQEALGR